jgi:hypothetical protein
MYTVKGPRPPGAIKAIPNPPYTIAALVVNDWWSRGRVWGRNKVWFDNIDWSTL